MLFRSPRVFVIQPNARGDVVAMKRIASSCVLVCLLISLAAGQNPKPVVEARMLLGADAAHANTLVKAAVIAQIASGFHLNDNRPTLNYLIPTELKIEAPKEAAAVEGAEEPELIRKKKEDEAPEGEEAPAKEAKAEAKPAAAGGKEDKK